eukprot:XP_003728114.1 PREDICTED: uncharacterized protein LOC100889868 [Strongylocentrotus purpuratus]
MFENVNPKFDGLNRRVELDGDDGRGDDVGFIDQEKRLDRMNIKNSDTNEHDDEDQFNPQGRGGGSNNLPKKEDQVRVKQQKEHIEKSKHRFQPQNRFDSENEEDEIYDDNENENEGHRLQNQPGKVAQRNGQLKDRHGNVHDNDFEVGDEVPDIRQAAPHHKSLGKSPHKVLPIGPEAGIILNHRGKLSDINPKDIAPDHGNVPDNDFEVGDEVPDIRQAAPHHKSLGKSPPKVLPIGPEAGMILNHRGKLSDINPKDIAPDFPDVLGRQPNQHKKDYPLQVPHEINADYRAVEQHNMNPHNQPKLPKFKPNRHINPQAHDVADMKPKPRPKDFPVTLLQKPDPTLCPRKRFVLIIVLSQTYATNARKNIRRTWGNPERFNVRGIAEVDLTWWVVFATGSGKTDTDIIKENAENRDILQGDFADLEAEETRKVMMSMKWLHDLQTSNPSCRPSYVLKTGSHVFVNTRVLTSWIYNTFKQKTDVYVGKVIRNDDPIRDSFDPHFVPYYDFKDEYFPDMVGGPTYMLSTDVVYRMVPLFDSIVPIAMDDSYIGILASTLHVEPKNDKHFVHPRRPSNVCHYKTMMYIYGVNPTEIMHIYNVIMGQTGRHCLNEGL